LIKRKPSADWFDILFDASNLHTDFLSLFELKKSAGK
jgi:hypothetical protein